MRQLIAEFEMKNGGCSKKKRTKPVRTWNYFESIYFRVNLIRLYLLYPQRKTFQRVIKVKNENTKSSDDNDSDDNDNLKPLVKRSYKWDKDIEMIHDMKRSNGDILYMVEYRNTGELEWVSRQILVAQNPFKIIEFYETCITWET